jgi:hypothetical protein
VYEKIDFGQAQKQGEIEILEKNDRLNCDQ